MTEGHWCPICIIKPQQTHFGSELTFLLGPFSSTMEHYIHQIIHHQLVPTLITSESNNLDHFQQDLFITDFSFGNLTLEKKSLHSNLSRYSEHNSTICEFIQTAVKLVKKGKPIAQSIMAFTVKNIDYLVLMGDAVTSAFDSSAFDANDFKQAVKFESKL